MQKELVKNCLFWLVYGYLQVLAESDPPQQSSIIQEPHPIRVLTYTTTPSQIGLTLLLIVGGHIFRLVKRVYKNEGGQNY